MKILIITNQVKNSLNSSFNNLLSCVQNIGNNYTTCDVVVVGHDLNSLCTKISTYKRVAQVLAIDSPVLANLLVENIATQLAAIVRNYTHVLINADSFGKNLLPRIAGILELSQISEVIKIISPNIFQRYIYAGNIIQEIESFADVKLLTIRASSFIPDLELRTEAAPIIALEYNNPISSKVKYIKSNLTDNSINLSNAKIVVSGGIALESKENFNNLIRPLAAKLNAAVGATRAAVEAEFTSNDTQIGQTGSTVAPQLYLAIGISGAVQHIAGMKDSTSVIAINIDANAHIFEYADYGIVADLFDIVPQLITLLDQKGE
ncbi:MAG: electron transfer flavoprotein subunit alpha/FixB family protein [Burkholderiales bacterium]|nr:electron transfer flavoprotein subunit alpha/FixB family protein [Burkholderiales bacterium]